MNPENNPASQPPSDESEHSSPKSTARRLLSRIDPYIASLMILLLAGTGLIAYSLFSQETTVIDGTEVDSQELSQADLERLAGDQAEIDRTNKILTVAANSVFNGTVLAKSSVEVVGSLKVGGDLRLNGLTVAGQSTINNLDVSNDVNVQRNALIQGSATIEQSMNVNGGLSVGGSGSFGGALTAESISANSLEFSGNLNLSGHLTTNGAGVGASAGGATGGGGTASVSGNDTAGTVIANTGSGTSPGILASVSFTRSYGSTPHVILTPVGANAGAVDYYVTRTSGGFSIGTASTPPSGRSYTFDYFVVQ